MFQDMNKLTPGMLAAGNPGDRTSGPGGPGEKAAAGASGLGLCKAHLTHHSLVPKPGLGTLLPAKVSLA